MASTSFGNIYFDCDFFLEPPKTKYNMEISENWFINNKAFQESVGRCINGRKACEQKIKLVEEKLLNVEKEEVNLDYFLTWKFGGGVIVGVSLTAVLIYAIKRGK